MIKVFLTLLLCAMAGAAAFAFTSQTQLTVSSVIQQQNLTVTGNMTAPASGTVGTLATVCSTQPACSSPSYSFQPTATSTCSAAQIAKNSDFLLSGNTLSVNPAGPDVSGGGLPAASYSVGITTTVSGTFNTPLCFPQIVTVAPSGGLGPTISINGHTTGTTVTASTPSSPQTMAIAVSGGPGNQYDWFRVCTTATPASNGDCTTPFPADYAYLNCSPSTPPSAPFPTATSPSCSVSVPTTTGTFYAVFSPNSSSTTVLASAPFTATAGGGGSVSITGVNFNSTGNAAITLSQGQGFSGTVDSLTTVCSTTCPGLASYSMASTGGAATLSGITLSNSSFTCSTAGIVGQLVVGGSGNISATTLSLDSVSLSQGFSLSSPNSPSNLQVPAGISCSTNPTTYPVSVTATLAGAAGSPLTQAFTIAGYQGTAVATISPNTLSIDPQSPQGTTIQFTCKTVGGPPCTGKNWTFSTYPSFLTPGVNWKGGTLTVNQAPPLPVGSGSVAVSACDTSEAGCVQQTLPPIGAPCDIYASTGTPCVGAYSTVRALYASYNGPMYQIQRASDHALLDIKPLSAGGIVNAASHDSFCASTTCQFTIIYDQGPFGNNMIPNGSSSPASNMPITINGHKAYGIYTDASGQWENIWEDRGAVGTPGSDAPGTICTVQRCAQGVYMVSTSQHVIPRSGGYFWGTCENEMLARGLGTCHTLRWTTGCWVYNPPGCGYPAGSTGPWIAVDFEGGDYYSDQVVDQNPADVGTTNTFVTLMSSVDGVATWNRKTGNAQSGQLTTWFSGPTPVWSCSLFQPCSPCANCYTPLTLEGGIILGEGGDGTNGDSGIFFEGAITRGRPSDAVDNAIQANIVAAGYTSIP